MLRKVTVKQYKSLRNMTLEPGPLTVLVGANAAGKSNVIDALRFLREAALFELAEAVKERGGFSALLYDGQRWGDKIEFDLEYVQKVGARTPLHFHLQIDQPKSRPLIREEWVERSGKHEYLYHREKSKEQSLPDSLRESSVLRAAGILSDHFPQSRLLSVFLVKWQFLQADVRAIRTPQRALSEDRLAPDAENLANVLRTLSEQNPEALTRVMEDTRTLLGHIEDIRTSTERGQVMLLLRERGRSRDLETLSLSDGTLRILAILTALHSLPAGGLLCIEEPEHGLHPLVLATLLGIIRGVCESPRRVQVLLTTHSPDLLDAAQPGEIAVVERDPEEATLVTRPDPAALNRWLKEFRLGELWRMRQLGGVP